MICVYPSTEKIFASNGLKILHPLKATIRKEDNGDYYLDLKDITENLPYYQEGMIIRVPTPWGNQGFRLTNPNIENNKITAKGYHLYFDSKNYIIKDSYVVEKNCNAALEHLNSSTDIETPFNVLSDITSINSYRCIRKSLEEAISDVIDRWGGHLFRDNFNIEVRSSIGRDRGVVISYGKNIRDIKASENWDNVITKILPVGKDGILLPETYLEISEKLYDIPYSKVISFEQDNISEEDYTDEEGELDVEKYQNALINDLRSKAEAYLQDNKFPKVNYSINAYLKDVSDIGDTIYVKHPKCNINLTTNVIAIEYDCISGQYTKIEFGNFKNNLKNLIKDVTATAVQKATNEAQNVSNETKALLEKELATATAEIWSKLGESYVIYEGDKILVVDKLPKEEAKNVMVINSGGIGFSSTGIDGTFNSAWTIDGTLNMKNINVINLVADMIKGGTLKLGGKDNTNGRVEIYDENGNVISVIDKNGLLFSVGGKEVTMEGFYNSTSKQIEEFGKSINLFTSDLEIYNLTIPCNGNIPLETKDFLINHYSYFRGKQVFVKPTIEEKIEGLKIETSESDIKISVDASAPIPNLSNEVSIVFEYNDKDEGQFTLKKKIVVTLVQKGEDGAPGQNGADGQPGKDGAPGEPGKDGANGKSAYQEWLDAGNSGTEQDFLNSLKGKDGIQGPPGENGQATYFYVKYSANQDGNPMTDVPDANTKYMGVASTTSPNAPTSNSAYTWSLIKGNDGQNGAPGQPGTDGRTPYMHIRYSEDGETFTPEDEAAGYSLGKKPSAWYGQYVDYKEEDSENFEDYTWYKFTEDIDGTLFDMQNQIDSNNAATDNKFQELSSKFNDYALNDDVVVLKQNVTQLQTDTYSRTDVRSILEGTYVDENGQEVVARVVKTTSGTFDENGMHYEKTGAETKSTINESGFGIYNQNDNEILFAGYDDERKESVVRSDNFYVKKFLVLSEKSRFEDYKDGTGCFWIGGS